MLILQAIVKIEEKLVPLQKVEALITFDIACQGNNVGSSKNDGLENDLARLSKRKNYTEIRKNNELPAKPVR